MTAVFISITRLRLRRWYYFPQFFFRSNQSINQAISSPGFIEGRVLTDKNLAFWTVTMWSDAASMKAFRSNGAHRDAMPKLAGWCDEACVAHWESSETALPDWEEINRQMKALGRPSPVNHPSEGHSEMSFSPPAPGAWRSRTFAASS